MGVAPVVIWIAAHGVFQPFWTWVVLGNASHSSHNPFDSELLDALFVNRLLTVSALLGGIWLLWRDRHARKQAWSPINGLIVAAVLAWLLPLLSVPNAVCEVSVFTPFKSP